MAMRHVQQSGREIALLRRHRKKCGLGINSHMEIFSILIFRRSKLILHTFNLLGARLGARRHSLR